VPERPGNPPPLGEHVRHRLSRGGNRQINQVLHIMAAVQLRNPAEGRAYYDRKKVDGKSSMEAMRCLERRLSDTVYRTMLTDLVATTVTGPGGHGATTLTQRDRLTTPTCDGLLGSCRSSDSAIQQG
jgi:hypothetical protein